MTKKSSTPAIRFKGFTDTWEQRELWELTIWDKKFNEVEAEKQPKIVKYPYVLADVFSKIEDASGDVRLLSTGNYIGYTTDEKAGKNLCVGEVVAIPWGGVPNIKYYKGKFVTADNRIATSNDTETLGNRFLSLYLEHSLAFLQSIYRGASIKHPSMNDVLSMQISIPHIQEQREIETWFANLDNLITLHQRKYDKLTNVKKSMLEKMFPKNGSNVPEIRFKGFTEAWEQRKAIDIADYSKGNGYSKGDLTDAGTPIILYGRLYTKYQFAISEVDTFAFPRNGAVYSQGNEVIVPASGETAEDIARASAVEKSGVLLGGDLNILRPFDFINPLFLALAISNGEPQKELAKKAQGKSVVHIHNTDIQEVTIAYPSRTEQDRIVSVFRQLDNLITLHQCKFQIVSKQRKARLRRRAFEFTVIFALIVL